MPVGGAVSRRSAYLSPAVSAAVLTWASWPMEVGRSLASSGESIDSVVQLAPHLRRACSPCQNASVLAAEKL